MMMAKQKLVKWQRFKTALCDLTEKNTSVEFRQRSQDKTYFSVKLSCEVHWIVMSQKDVVCTVADAYFAFCLLRQRFRKEISCKLHRIRFGAFIRVEYLEVCSKTRNLINLKFMFSKKATKIDKIFTVDMTLCSKRQIYFVKFRGLFRKHEL